MISIKLLMEKLSAHLKTPVVLAGTDENETDPLYITYSAPQINPENSHQSIKKYITDENDKLKINKYLAVEILMQLTFYKKYDQQKPAIYDDLLELVDGTSLWLNMDGKDFCKEAGFIPFFPKFESRKVKKDDGAVLCLDFILKGSVKISTLIEMIKTVDYSAVVKL